MMFAELDLSAGLSGPIDYTVYDVRRKDLINTIKKENGQIKNGVVVLFAGFERDCQAFTQEHTFYYFTGISEPGVVLVFDLNRGSTLYVPNCFQERVKWMDSPIELIQKNASILKLDEITYLGESGSGYTLHPFFSPTEYMHLIKRLQNITKQKGSIFTLIPDNAHEYVEQRFVVERLRTLVPDIGEVIIDISPIVSHMRRKKDTGEIEQLYKAIEITGLAHEAAAHAMRNGITEREVQASLEYIMIGSGSHTAFPSIVASGKNATTLHYITNNGTLLNGDLVVIDIGATYNYYCADLTRTYPVSGTFNERQRELYNLVLETQEYIASIAKPGYWLKYADQPEKSLHHLAVVFLKERGYDQYFTHGIGHFLGLDVHDVGDYSVSLQEGDVITIEPGIYIPEEGIGIRIEDNYWVVKDGVECLSENLPKSAEEIELMVQQSFDSTTI